jgi:hypothetical protein
VQPAPAPARKNVAAFRAYNGRRWAFEKDALEMGERAPFICECTRSGCLESVDLSMLEYESAHMCDNWCAVLPDHVLPDDESRVVVTHPHFWVVELISLEAALSAARRPGAGPQLHELHRRGRKRAP